MSGSKPFAAGQPAPWLHILFVLAVFFPYIQIVPTGTDVQPLALGLSLFILLSERRWTLAPAHMWLLGALLAVAIGVLFIGELDFSAVRSLGNYVSVFFISLASYSCAPRVYALIPRLLSFSNWTWFTAGLIQATVFPEFLYQLLPDVRRSASRGVVSLSPEPGFYATMCLFFLLLLFLYKRERSLQGLLCVVQIALLARSTLITGILLILVVLYAALYGNTKRSLTVCALVLAGWLIATRTEYFQSTRMGDLTKMAMTDPANMAKLDSSISDRVGQLVFSVKGAFDNYLLPNGFTNWGAYYHTEILKAGNFFRMYYGDPYPKRIQSGLGAPLYELDAFGLIVPWVLLAGIRRGYGSLRSASAIVFTSGLVLTLLPGTPLATPIYGFLIGYLFTSPGPRPARFARPTIQGVPHVARRPTTRPRFA